MTSWSFVKLRQGERVTGIYSGFLTQFNGRMMASIVLSQGSRKVVLPSHTLLTRAWREHGDGFIAGETEIAVELEPETVDGWTRYKIWIDGVLREGGDVLKTYEQVQDLLVSCEPPSDFVW